MKTMVLLAMILGLTGVVMACGGSPDGGAAVAGDPATVEAEGKEAFHAFREATGGMTQANARAWLESHPVEASAIQQELELAASSHHGAGHSGSLRHVDQLAIDRCTQLAINTLSSELYSADWFYWSIEFDINC